MGGLRLKERPRWQRGLDCSATRATAPGCLLAGTGQAISKRRRHRVVGISVEPEFMPKRNSKLIGTRGRTAGDGARLEIGEQRGS